MATKRRKRHVEVCDAFLKRVNAQRDGTLYSWSNAQTIFGIDVQTDPHLRRFTINAGMHHPCLPTYGTFSVRAPSAIEEFSFQQRASWLLSRNNQWWNIDVEANHLEALLSDTMSLLDRDSQWIQPDHFAKQITPTVLFELNDRLDRFQGGEIPAEKLGASIAECLGPSAYSFQTRWNTNIAILAFVLVAYSQNLGNVELARQYACTAKKIGQDCRPLEAWVDGLGIL